VTIAKARETLELNQERTWRPIKNDRIRTYHEVMKCMHFADKILGKKTMNRGILIIAGYWKTGKKRRTKAA
jgi:hypothetical protein